jgi:hypothetical protein
VEITDVTPTGRPRTGLPESVDVARVGDDCPLVAFAAGGRAGVDVVLLPPGGGFGAGWLGGRCSRIEATASACRCTLSAFTTTAAVPAGAPHTPQADANGATPYPVDGGGWILAPGQAITVWHDRDRTTLFEARDLANDGRLVVRALSDLVWEFRVQFAFENDAAPGTLEAWVTNPDTDDRDASTVGARLRAVRVGVIAGARAPSRTTPSSASLFPGDATAVVSRAEAKGALLRAASGTFILRNTIRY